MSYQDHLRTCSYCNGTHSPQKPTVRIKSASSYRKERALSGLAALITVTSYPGVSYVGGGAIKKTKTKSASSQLERQSKLRELARLIRG
jgi:hypothetical protein